MAVLCRLGELEPTGVKEVFIDDAGIRRPAFVVRHAGGIAAYFNVCPHARLPLNGTSDVFMDSAKTVLVCANHGAHFDPATGRCIRGPCKGESLRPLPVCVERGEIICTETDVTVSRA